MNNQEFIDYFEYLSNGWKQVEYEAFKTADDSLALVAGAKCNAFMQCVQILNGTLKMERYK